MLAMGFRTVGELQAFVAALRVPEERREVVESELLDHFFARVADGASEREALDAFGEVACLRTRFEVVEPGFCLTRARAVRDGVKLGGAWLLASALAWFV